MKNNQIRQRARERLKGHWKQPMLICFLTSLFQGLASTVGKKTDIVEFMGKQIKVTSNSWVTYLAILIVMPIVYGTLIYFLEFIREREVSVGTLFSGYKDAPRMYLTQLLVMIYTLLWTMLLIVPGIIKSISYSMSLYILKDNPDIGANEAITLSKKMMKGHKMQYFMLGLSFFGWLLLGILTFGIGLLWVIPYIQTATSYFYETVRNDYMSIQYAQEVV